MRCVHVSCHATLCTICRVGPRPGVLWLDGAALHAWVRASAVCAFARAHGCATCPALQQVQLDASNDVLAQKRQQLQDINDKAKELQAQLAAKKAELASLQHQVGCSG
jgi:septal ring factor EnvC (AmiA/AmiB activator)